MDGGLAYGQNLNIGHYKEGVLSIEMGPGTEFDVAVIGNEAKPPPDNVRPYVRLKEREYVFHGNDYLRNSGFVDKTPDSEGVDKEDYGKQLVRADFCPLKAVWILL